MRVLLSVGDEVNAQNLLQKGRPFIMRFRAVNWEPPGSQTARQHPCQDSATLCSSTTHSWISDWRSLVFSCVGTGLLVAISDKFVLPSVPLKSGGIGWNI